jgi:hypothetical protein
MGEYRSRINALPASRPVAPISYPIHGAGTNAETPIYPRPRPTRLSGVPALGMAATSLAIEDAKRRKRARYGHSAQALRELTESEAT